MTDAELAAALRYSNEGALADRLADRVQYASTSGEIFNGVGAVLYEHRGLRGRLARAPLAQSVRKT
jgi:hypothetical protein